MRFSIETPIAPVEKLTITSSPHSPRMASAIARKSSTSYDGVPSGLRAWMWMCTPPSSTIRRASAAYSSGVYGIAGHWSRFASEPEIEQVMTTGSSSAMGSLSRKWEVSLLTLTDRAAERQQISDPAGKQRIVAGRRAQPLGRRAAQIGLRPRVDVGRHRGELGRERTRPRQHLVRFDDLVEDAQPLARRGVVKAV